MIFDPPFGPLRAIHSTALMGVESAINKALEYDPATRNAVSELAGKVLAIESTLPPISFYVIHSEDNISLLGQYEGEPDTTLRGTALSLAALAMDGQDRVSFFGTGVEVTGDQDLLRKINGIMKNLEVDWEAALAQLIGDVPAHLVGESLRSMDRWRKDSVGRANSTVTDFAQEELRLTPTRSEADHFVGEVRHIATDVDRLAARMNRLRVKLDQLEDGAA